MYNKRVINNKYVILEAPVEIKEGKNIFEKNEKNKEKSDTIKIEYDTIIKEANEKASLIVSEAEKNSMKIIEKALAEKEKIIENANSEADKLIEEKVKNNIVEFEKKLENEINNFKTAHNTYTENSNQFITEVIKSILKKYLREEVFYKPQWINEIFNELKERIMNYHNVTLRVNSEIIKKFKYLFDSLPEKGINLKEDDTMPLYSIKAETEFGVFDVDSDEYIESILKSLEESINENN
ncbi:MAG TPA: FliH/SctL family protein [Tepiditoga sp.]|nr:FliH/SctL family protein [Tepiditoga sp.]